MLTVRIRCGGEVDCVWNVMAHAQKLDFVFRRNGRVHLNRHGGKGGGSVQPTTGRRAVHISLEGLYCSCKPVFCSHVTLTGYPLHSLVSPSLLLPCVTACHHILTGLYLSSPAVNFVNCSCVFVFVNCLRNNELFFISNFSRVLNVVCFLMGNFPASEFYMQTFRNTLFHLHRRIGVPLSAYEDGTDIFPKCLHIKVRRQGITQKKACNSELVYQLWMSDLMFPGPCIFIHSNN
jgi:hypothetical protein